LTYFRWYVEPTEAMKQKIKSDTEASLDKTNATSSKTSTSSLPHSHSITNSIRTPPQDSTTNIAIQQLILLEFVSLFYENKNFIRIS